MSIIKSILHKYNATSKAYDTLHPETESAQVTDWHKAVVNSLASTTLPAVVSALTTDSVMGKLMKLLLTASGVKYSIATNGYVCLGDFFGGLIIQWISSAQENTTLSVPLSGFTKVFETAIHKTGSSAIYSTSMRDASGNMVYIVSNASGTSSSYWFGLFI